MGLFTRRPTVRVGVPSERGNALTAAGYRVQRRDSDTLRRLIQPWQTRSFAYYDLLGEIKYAAQFYARGLAPLKLYAAEIVESSDGDTQIQPTSFEPAIAALDRIQDPGGGRSMLLASYGRLMFLTGESYLFVTKDEDSGREQWEFLSTDELRVDSGGVYVRYKAPSLAAENYREAPDDDWGEIDDDKTGVAYRIWQRHPRYSMLADSTMQGVLDLCVAEGTPVNTRRGPLPIEEVGVGDEVAAWTADGLGWRTVTRQLERGEQRVLSITAGRRTISATAEHPILVLRKDTPGKGHRCRYECEWVPADEIEVGDHLVALDHMPEYGTLQQLPDGVPVDEDVAWLLGQIVGDGHVHGEGVNISVYNDERRARIASIMDHWWGLADHPQGGNARFYSRALRMTLEQVGLRVKSHRKRVPAEILASPAWVKRSFLAGYEEADGHLTKQGWQSLALTSTKLARELRALYIELGENVSNIHVEGRAAVMVMPGGLTTENAKPLHRFQVYYGSRRKGAVNVVKTPRARAAIGGEHFTVATVKSVEDGGVCSTYDLEVEGAHNYIADGIVSHNCEELVLLTHAVRARARSRLAGNGILWIDDAVTDVQLQGDSAEEDPLADPFLADLTTAMTTPIVDEGSAGAVVPLVLRVRVPEGRKVSDLAYHQQLVDPMQLYPETGLRTECIHRIAIGLDMPPEILEGLQDSNHWCQSGDTEILARGRGWVTQDALAVGDEVYTLNHNSGDGEWQPVRDIYRAPVSGQVMYALRSASHSSLSTPEHRWPILKTGYKVAGSRRRWTTSAEGFATTDRVPVAACLADIRTPPGDSLRHPLDDFVRLLVAFSADGTVQKHDNIRIAKFADGEVLEMRRILTGLYGTEGFREHPHRTSTVDGTAFVLRQEQARLLLAHCGEGKSINVSFVDTLTNDQRLLMLRSCFDIGDGVENDTGGVLYQADERRLDAFAYAAHLSGFKVTYGKRNQQTGFGNTPLSWVRWTRSRSTFTPAHCEESLEAYDGIVWCPVTANSTWLARRNGKVYFTGNTAWQIDEQTWKSHLMPKADQLCADLTSSFFRPELQAAGVTDFDRYLIAYDPTNVINHPDRSGDALKLYNARAIGKEALRNATGFDDKDAPSKQELAEMVGVATRDSSLAWFGIPAPRGGALETAPGEVVQSGQTTEGTTEGAPTGGDAEKGPAKSPGETGEDAAPVSQTASAAQLTAARVLGAAEFAVIRSREVAGNRLRSKLKRNPDLLEQVQSIDAGQVCATVGESVCREYATTAALVAGTGRVTVDALKAQGITDQAVVNAIADRVEQHAARTLYREKGTLPTAFLGFTVGLLTRA